MVRKRVEGEGTWDMQLLGLQKASCQNLQSGCVCVCGWGVLQSGSSAREKAETLELRFWKVSAVNKGTGSKGVTVTMGPGTEGGQNESVQTETVNKVISSVTLGPNQGL